jgi:hypothetical protein
MKLLTKAILKQLPPLRATANTEPEEIRLFVKFFTPDSNFTWYAAEFDPAIGRFHGYVKGHHNEWGDFTLSELETAKGPMGLHIERDKWFKPCLFKDLTD